MMKTYLKTILVLILLSVAAIAQRHEDLTGVSITPSGLVWFVQVFPDGSVRASYGGLPQHQIQMAPGSIDFEKLVEDSKKLLTDTKTEGATQISLMQRGVSSHSSSYLTDDGFLRRQLPSDPASWRRILPTFTKDLKSDELHIAPISEEMKNLLKAHPIFPKKNATRRDREGLAALPCARRSAEN